jgi:hypothetical protein
MILAADRLHCQPWDFQDDPTANRTVWARLAVAARNGESEAAEQQAKFDRNWRRK